METNSAPQPTGKPPEEIDLTGMLIAYAGGIPVLCKLDGADDFFLPIFSAKWLLEEMMTSLGYEGIKIIEDGPEALASLPKEYAGHRLRIAVDLHWHANGKCRYLEIRR